MLLQIFLLVWDHIQSFGHYDGPPTQEATLLDVGIGLVQFVFWRLRHLVWLLPWSGSYVGLDVSFVVAAGA